MKMLETRDPHLRPNRGLMDGENAFYKSKPLLGISFAVH